MLHSETLDLMKISCCSDFFPDTFLTEDLLLRVGVEVPVLDLVLRTPEVGWEFSLPIGLLRINFCLGGVRVLPTCLPQTLRLRWAWLIMAG